MEVSTTLSTAGLALLVSVAFAVPLYKELLAKEAAKRRPTMQRVPVRVNGKRR